MPSDSKNLNRALTEALGFSKSVDPFKITSTDLGLNIFFSSSVSSHQIETLTHSAYLAAWQLAKQNEHPEIARIWNFIPHINEFSKGIENYQHFCRGRKTAFNGLGLNATQFPAASAVGSADGTLQFQFLFVREAPQVLSNHLQVEAYDYPSRYGPTAPSFARASLLPSTFFLSGTASIRGHESLFVHDLDGQLNCTLENIDAVLKAARNKLGRNIPKAKILWRVYLRNLSMQKKNRNGFKFAFGWSN